MSDEFDLTAQYVRSTKSHIIRNELHWCLRKTLDKFLLDFAIDTNN